MKTAKAKALLYEIRVMIIDEIQEMERMKAEELEHLYKYYGSYSFGYRRGLTEAAMIMLEKIYEVFPEEKAEDKG